MPAEMEWFANIDNPRTRRAYKLDVADFMAFVGIQRPRGVPHRHACPLHRVAAQPGGAGAFRADDPAQALGAFLVIRAPVRLQRCFP